MRRIIATRDPKWRMIAAQLIFEIFLNSKADYNNGGIHERIASIDMTSPKSKVKLKAITVVGRRRVKSAQHQPTQGRQQPQQSIPAQIEYEIEPLLRLKFCLVITVKVKKFVPHFPYGQQWLEQQLDTPF